jgi:hypothetical protein
MVATVSRNRLVSPWVSTAQGLSAARLCEMSGQVAAITIW